jgi:hypothetical protein
LDLRDSFGFRRAGAFSAGFVVGGWMVVEDPVEPGLLGSSDLLGPAASSSESSSQPTSSSADAAGRRVLLA